MSKTLANIQRRISKKESNKNEKGKKYIYLHELQIRMNTNFKLYVDSSLRYNCNVRNVAIHVISVDTFTEVGTRYKKVMVLQLQITF